MSQMQQKFILLKVPGSGPALAGLSLLMTAGPGLSPVMAVHCQPHAPGALCLSTSDRRGQTGIEGVLIGKSCGAGRDPTQPLLFSATSQNLVP